jgi:ubiquinone/menaquinone biosynthesis C-methylase UbiE
MIETNAVVQFYQTYDEDSRMARNPLEYIRCKEILSRHLSRDAMTILDVGGATGAFSFWLAGLGHRVTLIDLTSKHIELALQHERENGIKLASAVVGDARRLPCQNDTFDLVLLMGPLYHLHAREDRLQCLREAYRVLKPGGRVICEAISRFASMIDGFFRDLVLDPDFIDIMNRDIATGVHQDTSGSRKYFTDAYLHLPQELPDEIVQSGFLFEDFLTVTSFGHIIPDVEDRMKDEKYLELLLSTMRKVEREPSLMGVSSHFMAIGKKELSTVLH